MHTLMFGLVELGDKYMALQIEHWDGNIGNKFLILSISGLYSSKWKPKFGWKDLKDFLILWKDIGYYQCLQQKI